MSKAEHIGGIIEPLCSTQLPEPGVDLFVVAGSYFERNLRAERITEQELIKDYISCLETAQETLAANSSPQESELRALVDRYWRLSSYISHAALNEAIEGLAARQATIIDATDTQLAFMVASAEDDACTHEIRKSNGYIAESIRRAIVRTHPDMVGHVYLADPIRSKQRTKLKDPATRICWTDDWIATGEQMNYNVGGRPFNPAAKIAEGMAEINLIAVRRDQLPYGFFDFRDEHASVPHQYEPPLVGYWLTPDIGMQRTGPMPFGFHASCDWGFADTLGAIARGLKDLSEERFYPMAQRIISPYNLRV